MAERTFESGFIAEAGIAELVIADIKTDITELKDSKKAGNWSGELPLEDTSVEGIFSATANLFSVYEGSSTDPDCPYNFYLANGNDSLGVRFQSGSEGTVIEVVSKDPGSVSRFIPELELSSVTGEVTALHKIDYNETRYETLDPQNSGQACELIAEVVAAARWDFVFNHTGSRAGENSAMGLIEQNFAKREAQIKEAQASLDADRAMYEALSEYHRDGLAGTLIMEARVVVDGVVGANVTESGRTANRLELLGRTLDQLAHNMGAVALSDNDVSVAIRVLSDLKRPAVVDVQKDPYLLRWAQKYHRVYNGVSDTDD